MRDRLGVRRGAKATWQSPGGPHGVQERRPRGRRPRDHAGTRGLPCGATRVAEQRGDMRQLIGESSPLFNRVVLLYFFRVGLCSHTVLFCRTRGGLTSVRCGMNGGDRVDPSPRDHQIHHVRKRELK